MVDGGQSVAKAYKPGPGNRALAATGMSKEQIAQQVIEQYLDGKPITEQAKQLHISIDRLYQILHTTAPDDWAAAQSAKAWLEYERAKGLVWSAPDKLELARAREASANARFELSALNRRLFGQDQPPAAAQVAISLNLSGYAAPLPAGNGSIADSVQD